MSHILKHLKCRSNLQRHSSVPFLSAFTQDIVSQHPSSSLGDLHLIRSSRNDISQPAAWHCGSAKQQIQVVDFFFSCWHFWKSWINAVFPLGTVWTAIFALIPVPLQNQSYRTEEVGHPHMKTPGWKGMLWDLKISSLKTLKSREMGHDTFWPLCKVKEGKVTQSTGICITDSKLVPFKHFWPVSSLLTPQRFCLAFVLLLRKSY